MDDLPIRLEQFRNAFRPAGGTHGQQIGEESYALRCNGRALSVLAEAADEITRLRAELDACETELRTVRTSQAESNAEIERLRAELAELRDKLKVCFPLLDEVGLDEEIHCCEWILQQERKRLHAAMAGGE